MSQDNVEPTQSQSHTQTPEHRDPEQPDHDTQPIVLHLEATETDPKQITAEMPEVSIRNELDEISRNIDIERAADVSRLKPQPETLVSRGRRQLLYKATKRATIVSVAVYAAVLVAGVAALISAGDNETRASSEPTILGPILETEETSEPPATPEGQAGPERPDRSGPEAVAKIGPSKASQGEPKVADDQTPSKVSKPVEPTTTTTTTQETTTTAEAVTTSTVDAIPVPTSTTSTVAEEIDPKEQAREARKARQKARRAERNARKRARDQARIERIRQQRENQGNN